MIAAIRRGSFSKEGRAFKATCKVLGIPYTYKAINAFIGEISQDGPSERKQPS